MTSEQRTQLWVAGIFLAVIIAITVIAAIASSGSNPSTTSPTAFTATQTSAVTPADHVRGNANAKVTLIEYGDFECPACGAYEPLVQQLYSTYKDKILFVFRNYPLYQIHPHAMISAQAAEAANLQGKYWEMHDLLYTKQTDWASNANAAVPDSTILSKYFDGYAQSLGLDMAKFNNDINSSAVKTVVQNDLALGNAAKVDHTPTFFINLTQIVNPTSAADFQKDIDAALASTTAVR